MSPAIKRFLLFHSYTVLAFAGYAVFFLALHAKLGDSVSIFSFVPVVIVAWLNGMLRGIIAAFLADILLLVLLHVTGSESWEFAAIHRLPGLIAVILISIFVGYLHNLRRRMKQELEQKRATEAVLRASEARFKAIYEGTSDAVMLLDEKGFFDCNPRTLEMFGFSVKEDFCRTHPADISPPNQPDGTESFPAAQERIKTALQQGSNRFEWLHHRTNGEDFPAEVLLSAFELDGKRILQATVRDITKRKQAELALQQREAMLSGVYSAVPVGISVSRKRTLLTINRQITEISGYSADELVGKSARIFAPDDGEFERVGRELYSDLRQKRRSSVETRWKRKDGVLIDVLISAAPIEDTDQEVVTVLDITNRKRAEGALVESEQSFRQMFETTSEGVTLISPQTGRFVAANPAMCRLFGYTEEEFLSLTPEDITPTETKDIMQRSLDILFNGGTVPDHEGVSITRAGIKLNVIVSNRPMSWKGDTVFHVTFKDVTFLKEVQKHLQVKNREILDVTDQMVHDLRKPLTSIKVVFALLEKGTFGALSEDAVETLGLGSKSADYMQRMLDDLLHCARMESGVNLLKFEKFSLREIIDEVCLNLKPQIDEYKITLIASNLDVPITADRKSLSAIFMNLIGNAIVYANLETEPRITIGYDCDRTVFSVADNGIGIPLQSRATLFQKFKRGANTGGISGTGIGLAIVKSSVEAHGGTVWFESELGKGTTFYFTIKNQGAGPPPPV